VGARPFETINSVRTFTREIPLVSFIRFERPVEFPSFVGGIEIVRRDENFEAERLRGLEDALHVRDGTYLPETLVDRWPRESFLAEHLILRVDKDYRGVTLVDVHSSLPVAVLTMRWRSCNTARSVFNAAAAGAFCRSGDPRCSSPRPTARTSTARMRTWSGWQTRLPLPSESRCWIDRCDRVHRNGTARLQDPSCRESSPRRRAAAPRMESCGNAAGSTIDLPLRDRSASQPRRGRRSRGSADARAPR